jgi:hypothetical protein
MNDILLTSLSSLGIMNAPSVLRNRLDVVLVAFFTFFSWELSVVMTQMCSSKPMFASSFRRFMLTFAETSLM